MLEQSERIKRWRLILGKEVEKELDSYGGLSLSPEELLMDDALAALYNNTDTFNYEEGEGEGSGKTGKGAKRGGRGRASPRVAKWLLDIRNLFKEEVVSVIQSDAIERKGLKQLLLEPETLKNIKPDLEIVSTLMALKGQIPEATKETARLVVRSVVEEINKKLESGLRQAVSGALNKRAHSPIPQASSLDFKRTLDKNIKNYVPELNTVVPEKYYFFDRSVKRNKWTVIVDIDTSGSMADSVIYASVAGCIFAGISSLQTRVIAFSDEVVDLTDTYGSDPVEMIFGIQLGGGTDINKSLTYAAEFIKEPAKTLFILISDLYEGGNRAQMFARLEYMAESGVKAIALLALSDTGRASYDEDAARKLAQMGIPAFGCTPKMLPSLVEAALKGRNLFEFAKLKKERSE